jgi:hypothetical protein
MTVEEKDTMTKKFAITETSLKVFKMYADDAGNWSGTPLVGGNVGGTKEERGNLTQLKKAGLIETFESDGHKWLSFTEAGFHYACEVSPDYKANFGEWPESASIAVVKGSELDKLIQKRVFGDMTVAQCLEAAAGARSRGNEETAREWELMAAEPERKA